MSRWVCLVMIALCACAPKAPPRIVEAGAGDVAALVRRHVQENPGRRTLVYVGASWCELCRHLKDGVKDHKLDDVLANVDLLAFDLDVDRERLEAAGYASRMIPLVCVPDAQGRGTERRIAGSIKGEGALMEMKPRLAQLLGR